MVIGMQAVLPFGTERLFTRFFYQALTAGQPVAEALRLARLAIADDLHNGGTLVNWSVPALFVGGSLPGPVTDPTAKAEPLKRTPRIALRLGVRQRELRFISRLTELREAVDVLSERSPARLLQVVGLPGTGKSSFLDRVLEELDDDVLILSVSAGQLLEKEDALGELCDLVHGLLLRAKFRRVARRSQGLAGLVAQAAPRGADRDPVGARHRRRRRPGGRAGRQARRGPRSPGPTPQPGARRGRRRGRAAQP